MASQIAHLIEAERRRAHESRLLVEQALCDRNTTILIVKNGRAIPVKQRQFTEIEKWRSIRKWA